MLGRTQQRPPRGLKIIIVGCGKVGAAITEKLYKEGHDITLIDLDARRISNLTDLYDVMGFVGNGASYKLLQEAGIESAELLIAVTNQDELNLLCCTVARRSGRCAVIARVRNPEYGDEIGYLKEKLELAMIINPEREASREIARMLSLPMALSVNSFASGQAELVRFKLPEANVLVGKNLIEVGKMIRESVLFCAVERGNGLFVPTGTFVFEAGDTISFIGSLKSARSFFVSIGMRSHEVRSVMIVGGGKAAYYLGRRLLENDMEVRIIEISQERCDQLSDLLPEAIVINGDGTDTELLKEEGLGTIDAFIPLTGLDEENILLTLHAAQVSDAKVITKIKRNTFHDVINKLELGSVVYPKNITAEAIVAYVRGLSASRDIDEIKTLYHLYDERVEAIEFRVDEASKVTGIMLKDLKRKPDVLIGCISRHNQIIVPGGFDTIEPGDSVVIVTTQKGLQSLDDILA